MKDKKIGKIFKFENKKYKVEYNPKFSCSRCDLLYACDEELYLKVGNCYSRKDKKDVHFVEVKED